MADKKTSSRVEISTTNTPLLVPENVSFAPVAVTPSPLTSFVDKIIPAATAIAARDDGKAGPSTIPGLISNVSKMADEAFQDLKNTNQLSKGAMRDLQGQVYNWGLELAKQSNMPTSEFKTFATQLEKVQGLYGADRVEHKQVGAGVNLVLLDGDALFNQIDKEAIQAEQLLGIQETVGSENMSRIALALNGMNTDGTPAKDPELAKRTAGEYVANIIDTKFQISDYRLSLEANAAANDLEAEGQRGSELVANKAAAFMKSNFNLRADNEISRMLLEDDYNWFNKPVEQASGELRRRLRRLVAGDTEYNAYMLKANKPQFFEDEIEKTMVAADSILRGLNTLNIKQYDTQKQQAIISFISNKQLLSLGDQAVAIFGNSQALNNIISTAVGLDAFERTQGSTTTPLGAATIALMTGASIDSMEGRLLQIAPLKNTEDMNPDIGWVSSEIQTAMRGLTTKGAPTTANAYGVYEMIQQVKASPAVDRWLKSPKINEKTRQNFVDLLNMRESALINQFGVDPQFSEQLYRKKYKPSPIFSEGLPTIEPTE